MPAQSWLLSIAFDGSLSRVGSRTSPGSPPDGSGLSENELLTKLSGQTSSITSEIEDELASVLDPRLRPKVEIGFSRGSILIAGTVLLLQRTGEIAFEEIHNQPGASPDHSEEGSAAGGRQPGLRIR
jgi:hypothetical protein